MAGGSTWGSPTLWTATASGEWTDPANWSGGVPGPGDDAIFAGTIALTVTYDTSGQYRSILYPGGDKPDAAHYRRLAWP